MLQGPFDRKRRPWQPSSAALLLVALAMLGVHAVRATNTCDRNLFISPSYYASQNCLTSVSSTYTCSFQDKDFGSCSGSCYSEATSHGWPQSVNTYCTQKKVGGCSCFFGICLYDLNECDCTITKLGPNCVTCKSNQEYGAQCQNICPPCGSFGTCSSGPSGDGSCSCGAQYARDSNNQCNLCAANRWGTNCQNACPNCGTHGSCSSGISGTGSCICQTGFASTNPPTSNCDTCGPNRGGPTCALCPSGINGQVCSGHGTCNTGPNNAIGGTCTCSSGFYGADCSQTTCGDSIVAGSEQCDLGTAVNNAQTGCCSSGCTFLLNNTLCTTLTASTYCQEYRCNPTGQCNRLVSSGLCVCGNGVTDPGEQCDTGVSVNNNVTCTYGLTSCSGCFQCNTVTTPNANVKTAYCGDGIVTTSWPGMTTPETCDDGNSNSGDGCSSSCQIETGYVCTNNLALNPQTHCQVCSAFKYGTGCTSSCVCNQGLGHSTSCDKVTGACACAAPWIGSTCNALPSPTSSQVTANPSSLAVGDNTTTVTFTGAFGSSLTYIAFVPATASGCTLGSLLSITTLPAGTSTTLSTGLPQAIAYSICYSQDGGQNYVKQTATITGTAAPPSSSSISGISPATAVTNTQTPAITFTGAIPSSTTRVGFSTTADSCATVTNITPLSVTLSIPPTTVVSGVFSTVGTYYVCYSTDSGASWQSQSSSIFLTVTAALPNANSISSITPTSVGTQTAFSLTLRPNANCRGTDGVVNCQLTGSSTSFIAFIPATSVDCSANQFAVTNVPVSALSGGNYTVSIDANAFGALAAGTYRLCYSTEGSNPSSFSLQVAVASIGGSAALRVTPAALSANTITAINPTPSVVYALTPATLDYVGLQPSSTTYVGFLPQGYVLCATANLVLTFNANDATTSYDLVNTFSTAGVKSVCVSVSGASGPWVKQTVTLPVYARPATSSSISQVVTSGNVPSSSGVFYATNASFNFVDADPSSLSYVAFVASDASDCSGPLFGVTQLVSSPITINDPTWITGEYSVCYSTDGGQTYVLQTSISPATVTVSAPAPTSNSITSVTPSTVSVATQYTFTFNGAAPSPSTQVALSPFQSCPTGSLLSITTLATSNQNLITAPASAGTYYVCYVTNGLAWTFQSLVTISVVPPPSSSASISAISPATAYTDSTTPAITFTGAVPSITSQIAFSATSGSCATLLAVTQLLSTATVVNGTFSAPGTYYVCYSTDSGATWQAQSASVFLTVLPAVQSAFSVSSITPTQATVSTSFSLTITPNTACRNADLTSCKFIGSSTSFVAFVPQGASSCAGTKYGQTAVPGSALSGSTYTVSISSSAFPSLSAGYYSLCYSSDGTNYVIQVNAGSASNFGNGAALLVVPPAPAAGSITAVSPSSVVVFDDITLTFSGLEPSSLTYVGFLAQGQTLCRLSNMVMSVNAKSATTTYDLPTEFTTAGTYTLCLSTTGTGNSAWVQQSVTLTVLPRPAEFDSITQIVASGNVPSTTGVYFATSASFTFTGLDPSAQSYVAFVATADCSATRYGVTHVTSAPIAIVDPSWPTGSYYLCYSTDSGNTYVLQNTTTPAKFNVLAPAPTATSITAISPSTVNVGTQYTFTFTGAVPSSNTQVAFSSSQSCGAGSLLSISTLSSSNQKDITAPAYAGTYYVCYDTNSFAWTYQSSVTLSVVAPAATTSSITAISPAVAFTSSTTPQITFSGAVPSSTTQIAFSTTLGSCTTRVGVTLLPASLLTPTTAVNGTFSAAGVYYLCYSTTSGASWQPQSAAVFLTVEPGVESLFSVLSITPTQVTTATQFSLSIAPNTNCRNADTSSCAFVGSPTTYVAFVPLTATDCNTTQYALTAVPATALSGSKYIVTIPSSAFSVLAAGYYQLCYSSDSIVYDLQAEAGLTSGFGNGAAIHVVPATPTTTTISAITPSSVNVYTPATLTFTGLQPSSTTNIGFLPPGQSTCSLANMFMTIGASSATTTYDLPAMFTSTGTYAVCLSTTGTSTWTKQTVTLPVVARPASASSISQVITSGTIPSTGNAYYGISATFSFAGADPSSQTVVAFVSSSVADCSAGPLFARRNLTTATVTIFDISWFPGDYDVCYSTDGGQTFFLQTAPLVSVLASSPTASSITAISPTTAVVSTQYTFTFTGAAPSASTLVAFSPTQSCDSTTLLLVTNLATTNQKLLTAPSNAGTYYVCYLTNSQTWTLQTGVTLSVVAPTATTSSISAISPATAYTDSNTPTITFTGAVPSSTSQIAFSATSGSCSTRLAVTQLPASLLTAATVVNGTFAAPGNYYLCYSTVANTWQPQSSSVFLTVVPAVQDAFSVLSITPMHATVATQFTLNISPNSACHKDDLTSCKFVGSSTSFVAFVPLSATSCSGTLYGQTAVPYSALSGSRYSVIIPATAFSVLSADYYQLCYSSDGTTFELQPDVGISSGFGNGAALQVVPATPSGGTITAITPSSVTVLADATLTFTGLEPSSNTFIGFLNPGQTQCRLNNMAMTISADGGTTSFDLPVQFTSTGTYKVCYSVTGTSNSAWVLQTITFAVVPRPATASSISQVITSGNIPNSGSAYYGTSTAFSFVGADTSSQTVVAFVAAGGDCAVGPLFGQKTLTTSSVSILDNTWMPGDYNLCYSTDVGSTYALQTATTTTPVTIYAPVPQDGSITDLSPATVTVSTQYTFTFTGAVPSSTTKVAFSSTTSCGLATLQSITPLTTSNQKLLTAPTYAGTYYVCYVTNGLTWTLQTSVTLYVGPPNATSTSITGITPAVAYAGATTPSITFTGAVPSPSTYVGFSDTANSCDYVYSVTLMPETLHAPTTVLDGTFANPGTYYVCYSTDGGNTWLPQPTSVKLVVLPAVESSFSVLSVSPTQVAVGASFSLVITPNTACRNADLSSCDFVGSPSTFVAFVPLGAASCAGTLYGTTAVPASAQTGSTYTVTVSASAFTTPGTGYYSLCYTNDGTYTLQADVGLSSGFGNGAALLVTPAAVTPTTLSSMSPSTVTVFTPATVTFTGLEPSSTTHVGFLSLGQSTCSLDNLVMDITANDATTTYELPSTFSTAGTYSVCLSVSGTDNGAWVKQTVTLSVVARSATASSISQVVTSGNIPSPGSSYYDISTQFSFVGADPSSQTVVAFVPATGGNCASGPRYGQTTLSATSVPIVDATWFPGDYAVCYSTNGGSSFVLQTATVTEPLTVLAAPPTATTITAVSPSVVYVDLDYTFTFTGAVPSTTTQVALSLSTTCSTNSLVDVVSLTTSNAKLLTTPSAAGAYSVCYQTNSLGWTHQANVSISVLPRNASSTTVTAISPNVVPALTPLPVLVLSGADASPNTYFAFSATANSCSGTLLFATAYTSLAGVAPNGQFGQTDAGTYWLCYSTDGGNTFIAQTDETLTVVPPAATTNAISAINDLNHPELLDNYFYTNEDVTFSTEGFAVPSSRTVLRFTRSRNCSDPSGVNVPYPTAVSTLTGSLFPVYGTFRLCYSVDQGTTFVLQPVTVTFTPPPAQPTDITADLTLVARLTTYTFTLDGFAASPTTAIAFVKTGDACTNDKFLPLGNPIVYSGTLIVSAGSSVTINNPQGNLFFDALPATYSLCYTTLYNANFIIPSRRRASAANYDFQAQTNVAVTAVPGIGTSLTITSITPSLFTVGATGQTFSLQGGIPSSVTTFAFVAAVPGGAPTCDPANFVGDVFTMTSSSATYTVTTPFPSATQYLLCYASDAANTYILQQAVQVQAVPPTPTATTATALRPSTMEALLQLTFTVDGVVPSSATTVGFALEDSTGAADCSRAFETVNYVSNNITTDKVFNKIGVYRLCVSTDSGLTAIQQTNPNTVLTVLVPSAQPNMIEIVAPSSITVGTNTTFSFAGAAEFLPSPTTIVAFSNVSSCDADHLVATIRLLNVLGGDLSTAITVNGTYYTCLSTDNGATYVLQTSSRAILNVDPFFDIPPAEAAQSSSGFNLLYIIPIIILSVALIAIILVSVWLYRRRQARLEKAMQNLFEEPVAAYQVEAHTSSNPLYVNPLYEANTNWRYEDTRNNATSMPGAQVADTGASSKSATMVIPPVADDYPVDKPKGADFD